MSIVKLDSNLPQRQNPNLAASDQFEYHPDVVAIDKRALPRSVRYSLMLILALISCALLWSYLAVLDQVVDTEAVIVAINPKQSVQPFTQSVIKKINYRFGDIIHKGDILAEFEPAIGESELKGVSLAVQSLGVEKQRLIAETNQLVGKVVDFNPEVTSAESELQADVFNQRVNEIKSRKANDETKKASLQSSILSNSQRITLLQKQLENYDSDLSVKRDMFKRGLATVTQIRELESVIANSKGEVLKLQADQNLNSFQMDSIVQDYKSFISTRQVTIQSRIVEIDRDVAQKQQQLKKLEFVGNRDRIEAMFDGVVLEATDKAPGTSVGISDTLLVLVPVSDEKDEEIHAVVKSRDAGWVSNGMEVKFKFESLPYSKHGALLGVVRAVSADSAQTKGSVNVGLNHTAKITITKNQLTSLPLGFKILPGMVGRAEVKVGTKRAYEYLLGPILDGSAKVMSEPN